jgi:tetratricopeptide (TPR) repeat protein
MKSDPSGSSIKDWIEPWQSQTDYQRGLEFFNSRRYEEALSVLERCLFKDPEFRAGQLLLGKTLSQLANYRESLKQLEGYLKTSPDDSEVLDFAAAVALYAGETAACLRFSTHLCELHPTFEKNLSRLILVTFHSEGLKPALRVIHQVLKHHSTWVMGYSYRGRLLELQGDYIGAEKAYTTVLELDPHQEGILIDLRRIWRGESSRNNPLQEAYSALFIEEAYRLADLKPTETVLKVLESWQLLFPYQREILEILVTLYRTLKQPSHALQVIERIPNQFITLDTLLLKAEIHESLEEHEQAFELYYYLSAQYPANRQAWLGIAHTGCNQVDQHRACQAIEEGLRHFPEMCDLWYARAILCKDLGKPLEVLNCLTKAIQINPHHTPALLALGQEHQAQGQYEQALRVFSEVYSQDPYQVEAVRGLAITHTQLNHWQDSIQTWQKLLSLVPGDLQATRILARLKGIARKN